MPEASWDSTLSLLTRARAGDQQALDELFGRYLPVLRRWASGRLPRWARDLADTQDLVQDTLLQVFRRIEGFEHRGEGALQAYLRQAVMNRIRTEIRNAGRRPGREELDDAQPEEQPSPLEAAIGAEAAERYEAALQRLRDEDRELIVARLEMGLSYPELAAATGKVSAGAARAAVTRAIVRLFLTGLGRLHDAEQLQGTAGPTDLRHGNLFLLAYSTGDLPRALEELAQHERPPPAWLVYGGRLEEARRALRDSGTMTPALEIARGELALAEGKPAEAIPHLEAGLRGLRPGGRGSMYSLACDSLATAFVRTGRRAHAISALEGCVAGGPDYFGNFSAFHWMRLRLRLAGEYRNAGRTAEARTIEDDLRRLLVYADGDNPLLLELQRRQ